MTTLESSLHPIDPHRMRAVMAKVPTSVAVVAGDPDGRAALVIGSFVSVSLEPSLVGFFVDRSSTSWPKLRTADLLGISVLSSRQHSMCDKIGRKHEDRFDEAHWTKGPLGSPVLPGAVAHIECRIEQVSPAGDHELVLVRVIGLSEGETTDPLVFHDRGYAGLTAR
ncbi:flavin reductase family protein [Streptomyces sp. SID10853]|uniref:flavin reductase family protein n=1 Tax=Streptomyces sp. SID10853 TaxID=2706028 RepID=UPI0013C04390|nr:flavin reductase family protein [Streptomyces sp. SID10853]NDZ80935.1 flavin reductase family protein [Streptomyces sp. SID10853]